MLAAISGFSRASCLGRSFVPAFGSRLCAASHSMAGQPAKRLRAAAEDGSSDMISIADFDDICKSMQSYDEQREAVIKRSRDIQKLSKQAIYSLHRGNPGEAEGKLSAAAAAARELLPLIQAAPTLRGGSFSNAVEEYAEAIILKVYLAEGRVATRQEVALAEAEEYLGGVLDFTGELNRIAVARATVRDRAAVQRARDVVESLQGQFLRLDLRNGALRKKYDALKYTLKKLESTIYELSLTEGGLVKRPEEVPDVEAGAAGDDDA